VLRGERDSLTFICFKVCSHFRNSRAIALYLKSPSPLGRGVGERVRRRQVRPENTARLKQLHRRRLLKSFTAFAVPLYPPPSGAPSPEGRREKGEGRREKGEGRREKGEGRREKGLSP